MLFELITFLYIGEAENEYVKKNNIYFRNETVGGEANKAKASATFVRSQVLRNI